MIVLQSLAAAGLIDGLSNPAGLPPGLYYQRVSVNDFSSRIECSPITCTARPQVSLRQAAIELGSPGSNPWPGLLRAALEGQIELRRTEPHLPLSRRYRVDTASLPELAGLTLPWQGLPSSIMLTRSDVAFLLDVPVPTIYGLIQDGFFSRKPTLKEVQDFTRDFVLGKEAARILFGLNGVPENAQIQSLLSAINVMPVHTTSYMRRRIWSRASVQSISRRDTAP